MFQRMSPDLKKEIRSYVQRRLEEGTNHVEIIAPYDLSEIDITHLRKQINGLEQTEISHTVDKSLMAGIVIRMGSRMLDLSLRTELEHLKHRMYESA